MTIEKLLEHLKRQRDGINTTIHLIEEFQSMDNRDTKRASILRHVRGGKESYNGKHWMQQPKNRAKMMRMVRHMSRGKK